MLQQAMSYSEQNMAVSTATLVSAWPRDVEVGRRGSDQVRVAGAHACQVPGWLEARLTAQDHVTAQETVVHAVAVFDSAERAPATGRCARRGLVQRNDPYGDTRAFEASAEVRKTSQWGRSDSTSWPTRRVTGRVPKLALIRSRGQVS
jgi:hypothetical protein